MNKELYPWKRTKTWSNKNGVVTSENWEYRAKNLSYSVTICYRNSEFGAVKQVSILKNFLEIFVFQMNLSKEPTMKEKLNILENTHVFQEESEIALEVFPPKKEILDIMDLYHIWILKRNKFPFYCDKIPVPSDELKMELIDGKKIYFNKSKVLTENGEVQIYFLQSGDGTELKWYNKQNFKDKIVGSGVVAVEFMRYIKNFSVLVCLPETIKTLPFGLGKRENSK